MEKLSPIVQESFGIQGRRIKKEKGRYICDTASGPTSVYITHESPESILTQHAIKEHVAASGFPWTDRFHLATTGQPFIQIGRDTYIMVKHPAKHRETDFESEAEVIQAFKFLAHFHIAAHDIPRTIVLAPASSPMTEIYDRHMNELIGAGKQARRGSRMSDFDVLFIKQSPRYCEIMQESIARLQCTNYAQLHAQAIACNTICHNALKEENLPVTSEATYITNFSEAVADLQLADVAALIRRYAQRSSKCIPASRFLEAYNAVNPLPTWAHDILHALLIFPWAFIKIITQYYSKKRNWTPVGLISRMDAILAERDDYEKYVEAMIK